MSENRDYYEVLGVDRDADARTIKRAFLKKARTVHPDVSDDPEAEAKFKELNEAYSVLSDEQKRANYDRYGTADGPGGSGYVDINDIFGGMGMDDLFSSFFGGGSSAYSLPASAVVSSYSLDIPALANGAVISPNSEFLALLGDQKSGVNVETPLSTMIDAFNAALDARGGTGNSSQPIELYIDGAKFARITGPYNSGETRRRGVSLVTGGA